AEEGAGESGPGNRLTGVGTRIARIERDGLFVKTDRRARIGGIDHGVMKATARPRVPGIETTARRTFALHHRAAAVEQFRLQRISDRTGDVVLQREQVLVRTVVVLRPQRAAV